jgi:DNA-binding IclR family transcriptional regulator
LPAAVLSILEQGPLSGRALARRLGVRWSTTFAVLHELERLSAIKRVGKSRAARFRRVDGP